MRWPAVSLWCGGCSRSASATGYAIENWRVGACCCRPFSIWLALWLNMVMAAIHSLCKANGRWGKAACRRCPAIFVQAGRGHSAADLLVLHQPTWPIVLHGSAASMLAVLCHRLLWFVQAAHYSATRAAFAADQRLAPVKGQVAYQRGDMGQLIAGQGGEDGCYMHARRMPAPQRALLATGQRPRLPVSGFLYYHCTGRGRACQLGQGIRRCGCA